MSDGILYLNLGTKHSHHLIVSVVSLRRHYQGPVAIVAADDGGTAEAIKADDRLGEIVLIDGSSLTRGGHGKSYAAKTFLPEMSPFDRTVFLDADTVVVGDISDVFPSPRGMPAVITTFANWTTKGHKIAGRLAGWKDAAPDEYRRATENCYPAINTGVMGWSRRADGISWTTAWRKMTARHVSWICDEIAAQLIFPDYAVRLLDDRWNWSPIYSDPNDDVRIIHGHGMKFRKKAAGRAIWIPEYEHCLKESFANIRELPPVEFPRDA